MAYIGVRALQSNVSLGDVTVNVDPYTTGTQQTDFQALEAGTHNIPAGQYKVLIKNDGQEEITVNGDTVPTGVTYPVEAYSNPVTQKLDLTPAITIVIPPGGTATYSMLSPSV
ncbi:MAG: hypothetical protein MI974_31930 [Chitinophagales bacterium]|nr:hypothetical protein [Chitinophagales bacterium]